MTAVLGCPYRVRYPWGNESGVMDINARCISQSFQLPQFKPTIACLCNHYIFYLFPGFSVCWVLKPGFQMAEAVRNLISFGTRALNTPTFFGQVSSTKKNLCSQPKVGSRVYIIPSMSSHTDCTFNFHLFLCQFLHLRACPFYTGKNWLC